MEGPGHLDPARSSGHRQSSGHDQEGETATGRGRCFVEAVLGVAHGLEEARGRGSGPARSCSWEVEGATATRRRRCSVEARGRRRRGGGGAPWRRGGDGDGERRRSSGGGEDDAVEGVGEWFGRARILDLG